LPDCVLVSCSTPSCQNDNPVPASRPTYAREPPVVWYTSRTYTVLPPLGIVVQAVLLMFSPTTMRGVVRPLLTTPAARVSPPEIPITLPTQTIVKSPLHGAMV